MTHAPLRGTSGTPRNPPKGRPALGVRLRRRTPHTTTATSARGCRHAEVGTGSLPKRGGCGRSSFRRPDSARRTRLLFRGGILRVVLRIVGDADLSELFPHAEVQKHQGNSEQEHDEQGRPTRLDNVRVDVQKDHAETLLAADTAIPANKSSSGMLVSTRLRASCHSSVGQADLCTSSGTTNHGPSGSIWVACASNARSRMW